MIPDVCFEDNACKCLENSESAPRAGCTDSTTSLDAYATLATIVEWIDQRQLPGIKAYDWKKAGGDGEHTCFTNSGHGCHCW